MQRLTEFVVEKAIARGKPYKLSDGGGLHLLVKGGGRYWRYSYRFQGRQKTLALGVYPEVSVASARSAHQSARVQLAAGTDPSEAKKSVKTKQKCAALKSFEHIAREWFDSRMRDKSFSYQKRILSLL